MPDYDAIVIGSGNNGLAAANVLAKKSYCLLYRFDAETESLVRVSDWLPATR